MRGSLIGHFHDIRELHLLDHRHFHVRPYHLHNQVTKKSCRSVGAVAELLDLSCVYGTPLFDALEIAAFALFNADKSITVDDVISALGSSYPVLGQHYFVTNPFTGSGVSPTFDFRAASREGDPNAFVIANKTGDIPAPTDSQDVDWLDNIIIVLTLSCWVYQRIH